MEGGNVIKVLLVFSAAFLVAGMVLGFMTNRHRVEGAPRLPTFNPKYWGSLGHSGLVD